MNTRCTASTRVYCSLQGGPLPVSTSPGPFVVLLGPGPCAAQPRDCAGRRCDMVLPCHGAAPCSSVSSLSSGFRPPRPSPPLRRCFHPASRWSPRPPAAHCALAILLAVRRRRRRQPVTSSSSPPFALTAVAAPPSALSPFSPPVRRPPAAGRRPLFRAPRQRTYANVMPLKHF